MLNLLAITLLAVIVKNPGMMQNINGVENNYDDVSARLLALAARFLFMAAKFTTKICFISRSSFRHLCQAKLSQRPLLRRLITIVIIPSTIRTWIWEAWCAYA